MKLTKVSKTECKLEHKGFTVIAKLIINDNWYSIWDGVVVSSKNDACFRCSSSSISGFTREFVSRVDRWINGVRVFGDDD